MNNKTYIIAGIIMLIIAAFLFAYKANQPSSLEHVGNPKTGDLPSRISLDEALDFMADYPEMKSILVDVRTVEEYNSGHVANAISLPLAELAKQSATVLPDKDGIIIVYCRSGNRSAQAQALLLDAGYTAVIDAGGILTYTGELIN